MAGDSPPSRSEAASRFGARPFSRGLSGVAVPFALIYLVIILLLPRFGWTWPGRAKDLADAGLPGHLLRAIGAMPRGGDRPRASGRRDIRSGEVVALEQQSVAARLRQGIGRAVAYVQLGGMALALAEPAERVERRIGLIVVERYNRDATPRQPLFEVSRGSGA